MKSSDACVRVPGGVTQANVVRGAGLPLCRAAQLLRRFRSRGTVIVFGEKPQFLSTFRFDCVCQRIFLRICLRSLHETGFPIGAESMEGTYRRYNGDMVSLGKGEILVFDKR